MKPTSEERLRRGRHFLDCLHLNSPELRAPAIFDFADLMGASLQNARLDGVILEHADLRQADLRGASLRGASLRACCLHHANLSNAILESADLSASDLDLAAMVECSIRKTKMDHCTLHDANLSGACFEESSLNSAEGIPSNLSGCSLDAATCARGWDARRLLDWTSRGALLRDLPSFPDSLLCLLPDRRPYDLFISYAREDRSWVEGELLPRLACWNLVAARDIERILPGDVLDSTIEAYIRASQTVLFVITEHFTSKTWPQRELDIALRLFGGARHGSLLPVRLDRSAIPPSLAGYVICELGAGRDEEEWSRLQASLLRWRI